MLAVDFERERKKIIEVCNNNNINNNNNIDNSINILNENQQEGNVINIDNNNLINLNNNNNNNNNNDDQYSSISSSAGSERLSSKEVAMVEKLCELYEEALRQSPGLQAITHHHDQQEGEHHNGKYLLPGGFFSGYRVGARDGQLSTPPQLLVGSKDDVILPEPFQRKRVFVRVLEDLGNFEFGNAGGVSGVSKALYGGDVVMAPFYLFEDYVAKHKVRLL
eukprot:Tbor_TRINITY_DN4892_c2_g2::TRINITY_DN4892_c2_g2_i13::g.1400::m.1400